MLALAPAAGIELFGAGSSFVTVVIVVCVIGPVVLWLARRRAGSQPIKDLLGISAAFLVLLLVTVAMIVVEHAGG